jgi:hypothetical protein
MKRPPWFRYAANGACAVVMVWAIWTRHAIVGVDFPTTILLIALSWNLAVLSYLVFPRRPKPPVVAKDAPTVYLPPPEGP